MKYTKDVKHKSEMKHKSERQCLNQGRIILSFFTAQLTQLCMPLPNFQYTKLKPNVNLYLWNLLFERWIFERKKNSNLKIKRWKGKIYFKTKIMLKKMNKKVWNLNVDLNFNDWLWNRIESATYPNAL